MRALFLGLVLLFSNACSGKPPPVAPDPKPPPPPAPQIVRVEVQTPCLDDPPPAPPPRDFDVYSPARPMGDVLCAAPWEVCLTADGTSALIKRLQALETWTKDAWAACRPLAAPAATPAP